MQSFKTICFTLRSWVHRISMLFRTFSLQLEDIAAFQCSSDSFPHWPHISGCVQNCRNYISMYHCSPIAGEGPENLSGICPVVMCLFMTFSLQLENNDTSKCSSDSFLTPWDMWSMWKTVRTSLKCINVLQSWGRRS